MARIDLTEQNGYIFEEQGSSVIQALIANSAVESFARREAMASRTKSVPRFVADAPEVVAEGAAIPDAAATLDEIVLIARKYAKIFHVSEEDINDSLVDVLNTYKTEWASRFARKYDNACLGVTVEADGTDVAPYTSVYRAVSEGSGDIIEAADTVTFADINDALGIVETSEYFDAANTVFMAHPKMLADLRGMEDSTGQLILPNPIAATPGSLFGYPLVVSYGAITSNAATESPTGNPLLIVGNRQMMINGVRGGVESVVSRDAEFNTDGVLLKTRIRRAFEVARQEAFAIVERTTTEENGGNGGNGGGE
jgi:HK97 family phage major capsid protein